MNEDMCCPRCGNEDLEQESIHNGIAMVYGPPGCFECGWSKEEQFKDNERYTPTGLGPPLGEENE